jgi:hypothetical protein
MSQSGNHDAERAAAAETAIRAHIANVEAEVLAKEATYLDSLRGLNLQADFEAFANQFGKHWLEIFDLRAKRQIPVMVRGLSSTQALQQCAVILEGIRDAEADRAEATLTVLGDRVGVSPELSARLKQLAAVLRQMLKVGCATWTAHYGAAFARGVVDRRTQARGETGPPSLEPSAANFRARDEVTTQPEPSSVIAERRANLVKPRLAEKGWEIHEWAVQAGVLPQVAYDYLRGRNTRVGNRNKLATALGIDDLPL